MTKRRFIRLNGRVTDITSDLTFDLQLAGLIEGKETKAWLACLRHLDRREGKSGEAHKWMEKSILGKKVVIIPDPSQPLKLGRQCCINGHVFIEKTGVYVNKVLVTEGLVAVDDEMRKSPFLVQLRKAIH